MGEYELDHGIGGADTTVSAGPRGHASTRRGARRRRVRNDARRAAVPAFSSELPTAPIVGLEELGSPDDDGSATRADRAREHEYAAGILADRGEWRSAYHHLRAAMLLVGSDRSSPVGVPDLLRSEVERLRAERARAQEQSRRDSLTAGFNRRYLDEQLATLGETTTGCVALADVDHFKAVNDTYGHTTGDRALRTLAGLMGDGLPADAFCARYGGEEFALVLPSATESEAVALCEAARQRVQDHGWEEIAPGLRITVSIGVSGLAAAPRTAAAAEPLPGADGGRLDTTDALLYVAKRAGRNAVAHRDPSSGRVRLAGPAAARRALPEAVRSLFPTG